MISKQYNLIKQDLMKIGKGALIAGTGVACTYILENIGKINFGDWTPIAVGIISILTNALLKFVNKTKY
jgi:hypothetical protein